MNRQCISSDKAPAAIGPYSQAIRHNGLLFVSGQLPLDPRTGEMAPDIQSQTRQCMHNIQAIVEAAGATMDQVVRCTIFAVDLAEFGSINKAYGDFFSDAYPARATVQVAALPLGARVEIDAIAAL